MINFLEFSFLQKYLQSPQSYLHKIKPIFKICFIMTYLLSVHYIPTGVLNLITFVLIFSYFILHKKFLPKLSLFYLFLVTFFILLCSSEIDKNKTIEINQIFYMPYTHVINRIHNTHISVNNTYYLQLYVIKMEVTAKIPYLLLRVYNIYATCLISHYLLILSTSYKNLIINPLVIIDKYSNNAMLINDFLFIISLSSEFIFLLEVQLQNLLIAIYLKNLKKYSLESFGNLFQILRLSYYAFYTNFSLQLLFRSKIIFVRKIHPTDKKIWIIE